MRIIVSGSRTFENQTFFNKMMRESIAFIQYTFVVDKNNLEIVHGGANGVDNMAGKFAQIHNIKLKVFDADWNNLGVPKSKLYIKNNPKYGNYNAMAGINRNYQMFEYAGRDNGILIAFWQNKSKGTADMIKIAKRGNMPTIIHHIDQSGFNYTVERIGI